MAPAILSFPIYASGHRSQTKRQTPLPVSLFEMTVLNSQPYIYRIDVCI